MAPFPPGANIVALIMDAIDVIVRGNHARTIPRWGYSAWCTPDDEEAEASLGHGPIEYRVGHSLLGTKNLGFSAGLTAR